MKKTTGVLLASILFSTSCFAAGYLKEDDYIPPSPPSAGGSGDMTKAVYDAGDDGSADTANALKANGANAAAGSAILGVDASGAAEGAFDVWTEAENTAAGYISGNSPTINTPTLTLTDGNGAAPTADGLVKYDRTTERIQVGDGATTKEFYSGAHTVVDDAPNDGNTTEAASSNSVYDHINGNLHAWVVGATSVLTLNTPIVLDEATGDEYAQSLFYQTNKATSGDDSGLLVSMRDTASPGASYLINAGVNTDGTVGTHTRKFSVSATGGILANSVDLSGSSASGGSFRVYLTNPSANGAIYINSSITNTGSQNILRIAPTYNQASGTAANTDLLINRTETAVGSGEQNLIDAQVGSSSKFRVDNKGYTQRQECFGELYETGGSTDITVTTAGTYYQWVNSTVGLESGNGYVDCDATTDDCIIESATCAGTYMVNLNVSFSGSTGAVSCAVAVLDTESSKIKFTRVLPATPAIGSAGASGLLALVLNDAVTVECTNDTNGDVVTPSEVNLTMHKIDS